MTDPRTAFTLHSRALAGPIADLRPLRRSLLMAEVSKVAYLDPPEAQPFWTSLGFTSTRYIERGGAQAYVLDSCNDRVVAFRGTEPNDLNDIRADINALSAIAETVGRVHRGFKREADDIWPFVRDALDEMAGDIWMAGHSLGGAIATIAAARAESGLAKRRPRMLYTFGSPRVGDHRYNRAFGVKTVRWVNNNDVVTRLPPAWMGFRHVGQERYLDSAGRLRTLSGPARSRDRAKGMLSGLKQGEIDALHDHGVDQYIAGIAYAARSRER